MCPVHDQAPRTLSLMVLPPHGKLFKNADAQAQPLCQNVSISEVGSLNAGLPCTAAYNWWQSFGVALQICVAVKNSTAFLLYGQGSASALGPCCLAWATKSNFKCKDGSAMGWLSNGLWSQTVLAPPLTSRATLLVAISLHCFLIIKMGYLIVHTTTYS